MRPHSEIKDLAFYGYGKFQKVDINEFFDISELKPIGAGLNTRAFLLPSKEYVLKEGRWDIQIDFLDTLKIKLPSDITEYVLSWFQFHFRPRKSVIRSQYEDYLTFAKYFGFFDSDEVYFHPEREQIHQKQIETRERAKHLLKSIGNKYQLPDLTRLERILNSDLLYYNFLPKEFLLYGKSFSPENNGKNTYFLIQEYIDGTLFHDKRYKEKDSETKDKLVLLAYLICVMAAEVNLVPDMRPRNYFTEIDWFENTDNVMITNDSQVKIIDTRWMWNLKGNLVNRGLMVPEMILTSTKLFLKKVIVYD